MSQNPTRVQTWEGYKGEFSTGLAEKLNHGSMKTLMSALAQIAQTQSSLLEDPGSNYEASLRISLARINPKNFSASICRENIELTGSVKEMVYTANLAVPDKGLQKVIVRQLKAKGDDIWKTRDLLILLQSDRIEWLVGAFQDRGTFLVMETTLGSWSMMREQVTTRTALCFSVQLVEAVQWIHSKQVIHCKIHPGNCLIKSSGNLVLSDFVSAVIIKQGYDFVQVENLVGRMGYHDFESLAFKHVSKLSDLFAAGCTIYEMDTGRRLSEYMFEMMTGEELATRRTESPVFASMLNFELSCPYVPYYARAARSKFAPIIGPMVSTQNVRFDASSILECLETVNLLRRHNLTFETLNNASGYLHSGLVVNVSDQQMSLMVESGRDQVLADLTLAGIYYDVNEGSHWNNLVATEIDITELFLQPRNQDWIRDQILPNLKWSNFILLAQRHMGKRIPNSLTNSVLTHIENFMNAS